MSARSFTSNATAAILRSDGYTLPLSEYRNLKGMMDVSASHGRWHLPVPAIVDKLCSSTNEPT